MATMVSTKPIIKSGTGGKAPGPNGNGSKRRNGHEFLQPDPHANRYRIGTWVALASIGMLFTSLSSAYVVRAGSSSDWVDIRMPKVLLLSTAVILVSSVTIEVSRRNLKTSFLRHSRWLLITMLLGLAFLASQLVAWKQLARQGIYLSSNPHSSFFYLLTATHALHLAGGLFTLIFVWTRAQFSSEVKVSPRREAVTDAVAIYWHFMDALWIYLFLLLFLWR